MMAWTPPHEKLGRKGQPRAVVFTGLLVSLSEEMEAPSCWGSLLCADTMRHAGTCSLVAAPDQSQLHKPALLGRACPHGVCLDPKTPHKIQTFHHIKITSKH